jgi:broad specificity phosphatase PhoE
MNSTTEAPVVGQLHLLFIRHGETQDNIDRILQGLRDTSLTDKGLREANFLAEKMRNQPIDAVYHSPLLRIVQTIEPILAGRTDIAIKADRNLTGQALGELEGRSYDSIDMSNPRSADGGPGVERFDDFVARLMKVLAAIVGKEAQLVGAQNRTVVIATHGVGITSIFKALEGSLSGHAPYPQVAIRGPDAYEVRWTDSDDVAEIVVNHPRDLLVKDSLLDWSALSGQPFYIERWGKKEKAV